MDQGPGGFSGERSRAAPSPMCATVEPLLYGFRTQTLDRSRMMMVAQHVAMCPYCSERVRQLDAGLRAGPSGQQAPASAARPGLVAAWDQQSQTQEAFPTFGSAPTALQPDPYAEHQGLDSPTLGAARAGPRWPADGAGRQGSAAGGRKPLPEFLRPPLVWFTGTAVLCALLALTFIIISLPMLAAPHASTSGRTTSNAALATATATAVPLPAFSLPVFSDWRAAYIAADGKVHIAALDGSSDLTGPALSLNAGDTRGGVGLFQQSGTLQETVAVSPDGHTLAYINQPPLPDGAGVAPPTGPIVLAPLAGGGSDRVVNATANDISWSPDGTQLAFDGQVGQQMGIFVVDAASGQTNLVPKTLAPGALSSAHVLGWIDSTHLALVSYQGASQFTPLPTPTAAATAAPTAVPTVTASPTVSPTTTKKGGKASPRPAGQAGYGALTPLAANPLSSSGVAVVTLNVQTGDAFLISDGGGQGDNQTHPVPSLSPDGKYILLSSTGPCSPDPCTDSTSGNAALVNTTTGEMHVFPNSTTLIPPVGSFAWSPDSLAVAQTISTNSNDPNSWLVNVVDLEQGSSVTIRSGVFGFGWSPDGKTIVVGDAGAIGEGKTQASAILAASPATTPVALPGKVVEFLGFVKTA